MTRTRMSSRGRRAAAACIWLAAAATGCDFFSIHEEQTAPLRPPRGTPVPFTRMPFRELPVAVPGAMVIRTNEEWSALWKRYRPPPGDPPAVDFSREMVALVYMGVYDSCMREGHFVQRVEQVADTLFVVVFHDPGGIVCDRPVEPVDMVLLPRSELPVRFVPARADMDAPPPARWLEPVAPDTAGAP